MSGRLFRNKLFVISWNPKQTGGCLTWFEIRESLCLVFHFFFMGGYTKQVCLLELHLFKKKIVLEKEKLQPVISILPFRFCSIPARFSKKLA